MSMTLSRVLGIILWLAAVMRAAAEDDEGTQGSPSPSNQLLLNNNDTSDDDEVTQTQPAYAILFPSFTLILGVVVFLVLSRFLQALPYTAVMFLLGTLMGMAAEILQTTTNHVNESLQLWSNIDSAVLLLVFLPGIIFKDAFELNVHLFGLALSQCLIFALPMVLAGTALTGLVAKYIFPYQWPMDLCFTFGSILAATDPVAVAICTYPSIGKSILLSFR